MNERLIEKTREEIKSYGYDLIINGPNIQAQPDIENNAYLPVIQIIPSLSDKIEISFINEIPDFSMAEFQVFNEEMANAERCAKAIQYLYDNTIALKK